MLKPGQKQKPQRLGTKRRLNLKDQTFGKLTVIDVGPLDKNGCYTWLCQCDCGNLKYVRGSSLKNGNTKSCGLCSHDSFGISKIKEILTNNNIQFIQEKSFDNFYYEISKKPIKFDLYVNNTYIIEFDGKQHFTYDSTGWNTKENYLKTKERDQLRNEYCKTNNIHLIRIPYTVINQITLEDLVPSTSIYLLK